MKILSKQQILERRQEIEQEFLDFLEETESDFGLDDIKEVIYNEEDQDGLMHIIAMFDNGQGAVELENIMDTINDAWNYFPHKILKDLSPAEMVLKSQQTDKQ